MTIKILIEKDDQKEEYLTRFPGLYKFMSLLYNRTLFFTRLNLLPDPFEGKSTGILLGVSYYGKLILISGVFPLVPVDFFFKLLLITPNSFVHLKDITVCTGLMVGD